MKINKMFISAFLLLFIIKTALQTSTGCPKKKYTAQNCYNIQTANDIKMKEGLIDR